MLTVAVREDAPFIRKLASADPDLNDLREHPRYRRLMGLPPLPPGPPRPVGVLPHLPAPSSVARGQIEQAFLRDRAHDPQLAISELDKAIPALGAELTAALPALDPAEKAALADGSRIGVYKVLEKRGLSALPPALQDTALMFFNRLGLAYFHDGDLYMAESYLKWALTLRPDYAPASYNLACMEAQQARFLPPMQAEELRVAAQAKIDALIAKDPGFFGPLAMIDGDLLGLGYTGAWTIKLSDEVKARSLR
jgi:tetratricopeptide (TPR) repeat protein